jgi:hypothetical protein
VSSPEGTVSVPELVVSPPPDLGLQAIVASKAREQSGLREKRARIMVSPTEVA